MHKSYCFALKKNKNSISRGDIYIYIPGPSFGVWLEVPNSGGLGRNQPGDPDMKVLVYYEIFVECEEKPSFG